MSATQHGSVCRRSRSGTATVQVLLDMNAADRQLLTAWLACSAITIYALLAAEVVSMVAR